MPADQAVTGAGARSAPEASAINEKEICYDL